MLIGSWFYSCTIQLECLALFLSLFFITQADGGHGSLFNKNSQAQLYLICKYVFVASAFFM